MGFCQGQDGEHRVGDSEFNQQAGGRVIAPAAVEVSVALDFEFHHPPGKIAAVRAPQAEGRTSGNDQNGGRLECRAGRALGQGKGDFDAWGLRNAGVVE